MFRIFAAICLTLFTLGYMAPASIACVRQARNENLVFIVNLFLGWTLIGWIAAAIMALSGKTEDDDITVVRIDGKTAYIKTSGRIRFEDIST